MMVLTTTATYQTQREMIMRLEIKENCFIYMPPAKSNIAYVVVEKQTIEDVICASNCGKL